MIQTNGNSIDECLVRLLWWHCSVRWRTIHEFRHACFLVVNLIQFLFSFFFVLSKLPKNADRRMKEIPKKKLLLLSYVMRKHCNCSTIKKKTTTEIWQNNFQFYQQSKQNCVDRQANSVIKTTNFYYLKKLISSKVINQLSIFCSDNIFHSNNFTFYYNCHCRQLIATYKCISSNIINKFSSQNSPSIHLSGTQ